MPRRSFAPVTASRPFASSAYVAQDWLDLEAEHGPSNFDQRHQLTAQVQYTTGMGIGGGALLDGLRGSLFRGWTVDRQLTTGSGLPAHADLSDVDCRARASPEPSVRTSPAVATAPAPRLLREPGCIPCAVPGRWGNAGRNSIDGSRAVHAERFVVAGVSASVTG